MARLITDQLIDMYYREMENGYMPTLWRLGKGIGAQMLRETYSFDLGWLAKGPGRCKFLGIRVEWVDDMFTAELISPLFR